MAASTDVDVLLVEDSPEDIELSMRALSKHNLAQAVHVSRDGAEAIAFLEAGGRPRVILLDLKMPKVNGLEVLRRIKATAAWRTLPVVVLTSSREEPDIARAYELGANSYIVKPVDYDQFMRAVSQAGLYWLVVNQHPQA